MSLSPSVDASLTGRLNSSGLNYPYLNCRVLNIQTLPVGTLESTITLSRGEVLVFCVQTHTNLPSCRYRT